MSHPSDIPSGLAAIVCVLLGSTLFSAVSVTATVDLLHPSTAFRDWRTNLSPSGRVYGSLIPPPPPGALQELPTQNATPSPDDPSGNCNDVMMVAAGSYYDFIVTRNLKSCAVLVQPAEDTSTLVVDTTEVDLERCDVEYLRFFKPDGSGTTLCGGQSLVSVSDVKYLLLQYERRVPTMSAFTIRVWAEPLMPAVAGRQLSAAVSQDDAVQVCPQACGRPASQQVRTPRVLGGTPAEPGEFPWMVQLYNIRNSSHEGAPPIVKMCGGSILDRRHILTAAHCVVNLLTRAGPDALDVIVGTNSPASLLKTEPDPSAVYATVQRWFLTFPPHIWRLWSEPYDIAVLRLTAELPLNDRISPVCLSPPRNYTYSDVIVTGYGDTENQTQQAPGLQKMQLTVRPNRECQDEYSRLLPQHTLSSHEMCMFAPGRDNCAGDSGGPAVVRRDGKFYQVGVISYGFPCNSTKNDTSHHGVYTSVSSFLPWIRQIVGRNSSCS